MTVPPPLPSLGISGGSSSASESAPALPVVIGRPSVDLASLVRVAVDHAPVRLADDPAMWAGIDRSVAIVRGALERGAPVYGVSTGFGASCGNRIDPTQSERLGRNLLAYHGCGSGEPLGIPEVRGAMLSRVLCFRHGVSGVSRELLGALVGFLNHRITPVVPARGSVGASGDLTPCSYIAAALTGERDVWFRGVRVPAKVALAEAGLSPHRLQPKEALALLNGTAVMTGIAIRVVEQARRLLDAATAATALSLHALSAHVHHLAPILFETKPHPGPRQAAARLRSLLASSAPIEESSAPEHFQDPYSLRCAPHVLGVLEDALAWVERWVGIEANGVDDNPLVDEATGAIVMGGNFYGGHVGFAMDSLKSAIASVADLCDRQVALLVDPRFNRGLPAGLVPPHRAEERVHHGFKALQITASALTAEALHQTLPASSFSRSTESHNQDKVSMGTIAATSASRVTRLVQGVAAAHLMVAAQGCELRGRLAERPVLAELVQRLRALSAPLDEDRPLDVDLERVEAAITDGPPLTP